MYVPLINPVQAVISRLDTQTTWAQEPPGKLEGYDDIFRESIPQDDGTLDSRIYMDPVRVPVQVETQSYEELRAEVGGDAPVSNVVLVAHRKGLQDLGLLDSVTGRPLLKKGDRIDWIEAPSGQRTVCQPESPLYIWMILPRSWGFWDDGYALEVIYTAARPASQTGRTR